MLKKEDRTEIFKLERAQESPGAVVNMQIPDQVWAGLRFSTSSCSQVRSWCWPIRGPHLRTYQWYPGKSSWGIPTPTPTRTQALLLTSWCGPGMTVCILVSRFVHPRFGPIKCIRTLRAVEADEELTVAYGYDHSPPGKSGPEAPEWYQVELKAFQATQQKWKAQPWASETWNRNLDLCTTFSDNGTTRDCSCCDITSSHAALATTFSHTN